MLHREHSAMAASASVRKRLSDYAAIREKRSRGFGTTMPKAGALEYSMQG
jgi:hypothetical protein